MTSVIIQETSVITRNCSNSCFLKVLLDKCSSLKSLSLSLEKFSQFSFCGHERGRGLTGDVEGNL